MSDTVDETRDSTLDRAAQAVVADPGGITAAVGDLDGFLRAYYRNIATEDLATFGPDRMAAVAAGHAALAAQRPQGRALVEVQPPGENGAADDQDGGTTATTTAYGLPWASVGADQIGDLARSAGLVLRELWTASGRWFAALDGEPAAPVTVGTGPCAADALGWPATPEPA